MSDQHDDDAHDDDRHAGDHHDIATTTNTVDRSTITATDRVK